MKVKKAVVIANELNRVEMIPLIDKPIIRLVIEEVVNAGIKEILIVLGENRDDIVKHFEDQSTYDYETSSLFMGDATIYFTKCIRKTEEIKTHFKDALLCSRRFVGDDPFLLLSSNHIFINEKELISRQIIEGYEYLKNSVIALASGTLSDTNLEMEDEDDGHYLIKSLAFLDSKRKTEFSLGGRYALRPEIFIYLERSEGFVDALDSMSKDIKIYGLKMDQKNYDMATKSDYVKSIIDLAMERNDLKDEIKKHMSNHLSISGIK
jgi:UTP--glucose-1-phosphate uridylyltransferase